MNKASVHRISAVVRTWNSARTLAKTLRSLRMQNVAMDEIIIVDSGSNDQTREIADRFRCHWIDYPAGREFNYSESLNLGIAAATGAEILIVSSHTVLLYRDIVETMRTNLLRHNAAGVYCAHARARERLPKRDDPERGQVVEVTRANTFKGYNGLSNSCSFIDRECWELHPFDPSMPSAEDQEWAHWFFQNTSKPTVRIKNAGVLYLNPRHSIWKEARDHAVIATRLLPALHSWRAISGLFRASVICAARGRRQLANRNFSIAIELLKCRFRTPRYASRY
jgi:glycosyltransferase involved in cell wall biosynthesis